MTITTCVFDAYGTVFDVTAAARAAADTSRGAALRGVWPDLARDWRAKQLEYTWLRAITGDHTDFWQVTQDGLDWALEAAGLGNDPDLRALLLELYHRLDPYAEAPGVLGALKARGLTCAILSNGSPDMLAAAVDSAGIGAHLDAVISVEEAGIFKPAAAVYDLVEHRLGTPRGSVLFVSSNGWDVCSAAGYGFATLWVNRAGAPMDRLPARPDRTAPDLRVLPDMLETL